MTNTIAPTPAEKIRAAAVIAARLAVSFDPGSLSALEYEGRVAGLVRALAILEGRGEQELTLEIYEAAAAGLRATASIFREDSEFPAQLRREAARADRRAYIY